MGLNMITQAINNGGLRRLVLSLMANTGGLLEITKIHGKFTIAYNTSHTMRRVTGTCGWKSRSGAV